MVANEDEGTLPTRQSAIQQAWQPALLVVRRGMGGAKE
jgi:hypothetical protein